MADNVFKTAVTPVSDSPTSTDVTPTQVKDEGIPADPGIIGNPNPSIKEYLDERGQPYSNEYFNTGTPYNYLPNDTQKSLDAIDKYVEMEIADRHWKDSVSVYNKIIDDLSFQLGLSDDMSTNERIERISAYAESMLKLEGVDEIRQQLKSKLRYARNRREASDMVLKAIGRKIL